MSDVFMCGCEFACIHACIHIVVVNVYVYIPVVDSLEPSRPSFFLLAGRKRLGSRLGSRYIRIVQIRTYVCIISCVVSGYIHVIKFSFVVSVCIVCVLCVHCVCVWGGGGDGSMFW